MAQDFTLHTHTNQFDGKNSVAEMAQRAKDLGMSAIGISNHFIVHPDIKNTHFYPFAVRGGYQNMYHTTFDSAIREFQQNYAEINRVAQQAGIKVLRGMEVDYFDSPRWYEQFKSALQILKPDYVIGACHFIEYKGRLCNVHDIANAGNADRINMMNAYWTNIGDAALSSLFTFMAHLDLPKKVGIEHSSEWSSAEDYAIDVIATHRTPIEINTSGYDHHLCGEAYPSPRILKRVANNHLPVIISDDAHHVSQIGRHLDAAEKLIAAHGIKKRVSLQKILDFSNKTL